MAHRHRTFRRRFGRLFPCPGRTPAAAFWLFLLAAWAGLGAPAEAGIEQFFGNWENPASDASGLRYVLVSPAGGARLSLRLYGDCHPGICDWGIGAATPVPAEAPADATVEVQSLVHFGFAARQLRLRVGRDGTLTFSVYYDYAKQTGKAPLYVTGHLRPTDWAGPIGKAPWETGQGRQAGWGGGPYGIPLAPARTQCRHFDPGTARLVREGGAWAARSGDVGLFRTRWDQNTALLALGTIRRYRFDAVCRVGTVDFWLRQGRFADETPAGANCIRFQATTAHIAREGRRWHVVDGTTDIYSFGANRNNALALLSTIRRDKLNRKCVLAWPDPVLVYWLSR